MKKISAFLLSLLLIIQLLGVSVTAAEAETVMETLPSAAGETAPVVEFGNATVSNGCRTMDAQIPMGGDSPMLKTAVSAFVYERNTGTLIYAYNPDLQMQPGTFAKMWLAIWSMWLPSTP